MALPPLMWAAVLGNVGCCSEAGCIQQNTGASTSYGVMRTAIKRGPLDKGEAR